MGILREPRLEDDSAARPPEGFWLYVIDVRSEHGQHLYVGRTGDSSSANAGSPFSRVGQHLDFRPKAKGNVLTRKLRDAGIEPQHCQFSMTAVGPLHAEVRDFGQHKAVRDRVAALEKGFAQALRDRGYQVLGKHAARRAPDAGELESILRLLGDRLPPAGPGSTRATLS